MGRFVVVIFGRKTFLTKVTRYVFDPTWNKKIIFHDRGADTETNRKPSRFSCVGSTGMGHGKGGDVAHSGAQCTHHLRIQPF